MDKEILTKYFEIYIENYPPYKDNDVFRIFIRYLVDYYYDKLYNIEPKIFKELFENSSIPIEIYDSILISVGFPKRLLDKITFLSKIILLKTFTDFEKYKSSLLFFQNIATSFQDQFNIYELFIDYNESDWILRPKVVYENKNIDPYTGFLLYDDVYEKVPSLLVNSNDLNRSLTNEELCLPIKSNLLLLTYDLSTDVSLLKNFLASIFVKSYRENILTLYFSNYNYSLSLSKIIFLWYYLLTRYYESIWDAFPLNQLINFKYITQNITDVENILQEYENINSRKLVDEFYSKYLSSLAEYYINNNNYTETDLFNILKASDELLMSYIDNRIINSPNPKMELISITNEIYNSILISISTSSDINFKKYSEYFLYFLTQLSITPENTDSYIILSELKPFHTELITSAITSIYVQDKFNQIYIDVNSYFETTSYIGASIQSESDVHSAINFTYVPDCEVILNDLVLIE